MAIVQEIDDDVGLATLGDKVHVGSALTRAAMISGRQIQLDCENVSNLKLREMNENGKKVEINGVSKVWGMEKMFEVYSRAKRASLHYLEMHHNSSELARLNSLSYSPSSYHSLCAEDDSDIVAFSELHYATQGRTKPTPAGKTESKNTNRSLSMGFGTESEGSVLSAFTRHWDPIAAIQ
ncbi:hypothetical protein RJ641_004129 [Dillenia turbinata]|uniref:Uncharacterized protein n=1 Tax=Dillenia turbinata TaxID=194707 RepID=A0AAN8V9H7_9MAGN